MKRIFNTITLTLGTVAMGTVALLVLFLIFFNIDETTGKSLAGSAKSFKGKVTGISCHSGINDINFTIAGKQRSYYINRGLEKGLDCGELKNKLIGKEVEISHAVFITGGASTHINRLSHNGKVIYSELK